MNQFKLLITGLAVIFGVAAVSAYNAHQQQIGQLKLRLAQAEQQVAVAQRRADSLDKRYTVDTVRFNRWRTKWDTVYHLTVDTLPGKVDSIFVPVRILATADSTIRACSQVVLTCEQRVGAERQISAGLREENRILRRQIPSAITPWIDRGLGAGVVYAIVLATRHLK